MHRAYRVYKEESFQKFKLGQVQTSNFSCVKPNMLISNFFCLGYLH